MSVLIHEQSGRRTIYYPDDRHLRQYADSGPILISIQVWSDSLRARRKHSAMDWPPGKMMRTHAKPRSSIRV